MTARFRELPQETPLLTLMPSTMFEWLCLMFVALLRECSGLLGILKRSNTISTDRPGTHRLLVLEEASLQGVHPEAVLLELLGGHAQHVRRGRLHLSQLASQRLHILHDDQRGDQQRRAGSRFPSDQKGLWHERETVWMCCPTCSLTALRR
jgi:hypothetical protein